MISVFIILSCSKDTDDNNNNNNGTTSGYPKKITFSNGAVVKITRTTTQTKIELFDSAQTVSSVYMLYDFNSTGKIIQSSIYLDNVKLSYETFTYSPNTITQIGYNVDSLGTAKESYKTIITLNANGNATKSIDYDFDNDTWTEEGYSSYEWTGTNLTKQDEFEYITKKKAVNSRIKEQFGSLLESFLFRSLRNSNIHFSNLKGNYAHESVTTTEYNNKPNLLKGFYPFFWVASDNYPLEENYSSDDYPDDNYITVYSYVYDNKDYPIQITETKTTSSEVETTSYTLEY
jgi:hypothetical protein